MANQAKASNGSFFLPLENEIEQQYFMLRGHRIITGHLNGIRTVGVWLELEDIAKAKRIKNFLNSFKKSEDRGSRCIIVNDKGLRIRCPENNACSHCSLCRTGKPLSLDLEIESKGDKIRDVKSSFEEDLILKLLARELMEHINKLGGKHKLVMDALLRGVSVRSFAEENGIGKSTAQDWYDQFRAMARDFIGE